MIVMIKTMNVNMDVAAENPGGEKKGGTYICVNRCLCFIMLQT